MTDKDPKDMTASALLRWFADDIDQSNCRACHRFYESDECGSLNCGDWKRAVADKIEAELSDARAEGISEGVDASLRQGAELWAKVNGWPDFREGEDFGAWLDRCALPRPRWDTGEVVGTDDYEDLLTYSVADDGCWSVFFADGQQDGVAVERVKRPAPEVLGADGLPIREHETVYDTETGEAYIVRLPRAGTGKTFFADGGYRDPAYLTHTPPDTQEKIDRDKIKAITRYWECEDAECYACPCRIDGKKPSEHYGTINCSVAQGMDIARRQRELDARTGGAE